MSSLTLKRRCVRSGVPAGWPRRGAVFLLAAGLSPGLYGGWAPPAAAQLLAPPAQKTTPKAKRSSNLPSSAESDGNILTYQHQDEPTASAESVRNRPRPDFDPLGIDLDTLWYRLGESFGMENIPEHQRALDGLGSFSLFPKLELETRYSDNIFFEETRAESDYVHVVTPSIEFRSNWDNHRLIFKVGAEAGKYDEFTSENYFDYNAALEGRLEPSEFSKIDAQFKFDRTTESRSSLDDIGRGFRPTRIFEYKGRLEGEYDRDAILLRLRLEGERKSFRDSGPIDNDDRDRNLLKLIGRTGYNFVPGTTFFVQGEGNARFRDVKFDSLGRSRNSDGYEVLSGITWDASGVTFAELSAGYLEQFFDDTAFETISGLSYRGRVIWNFTEIGTLSLEFDRTINDVDIAGSQATLATNFKGRIDYELFDNLILDFSGGLKNNDLQGSPREDDDIELGGGFRYLIGHNFIFRASYDYEDRESTVAGENYKSHEIMLRLTAQI